MTHQRSALLIEKVTQLRQELPYSPEILHALFAQTSEDSRSSLEDVAQSIASDPALTTRVLSIANSAYYGLQSEIASPLRAVSVLGLEYIRSLILSFGVQSIGQNLKSASGFALRDYWKHQILTAVAAKHITTQLGQHPLTAEALPNPERMYTAGLLHDMGKLLTAMLMPKDWQRVTEQAKAKHCTVAEAEEDYWGMDHGVIGAMALRSWNLPASLTEPVSWHHAPDRAAEHELDARILCLANALAIRLQSSEEPLAEDWKGLLQSFDLSLRPLAQKIAQSVKEPEQKRLLAALA
ncbi:HDOD domain-containing protein [Desulfobaculum bizertense]|uniref:HDOD domain-containing protein n=1 Tax=Desulfobaculum bizertense TaxID=376490 RepID=UPI001F2473A3|nr:HDOD domain-containing protein [Desulfobaculum bizertense]UIJ36638.1 HDOD domain-containing protein [Desulfobaculum bizertense]